MKTIYFFVILSLILITDCYCYETDNKEGKTLQNSIPTLTQIGRIRTKKSSEITSSPFGIQAGTLKNSLVARAAEIGVKWTRLGAGWSEIEREKGVYSWDKTDKAFEVALTTGLLLLLQWAEEILFTRNSIRTTIQNLQKFTGTGPNLPLKIRSR